VAKKVFQLVAGRVDAIGGLTLGADPIVAAVAVISHLEGQPIPAFIVRAEFKKHGTQKKIEGHLPKGGRVAIIEDVITTGGSVFKAIEAVEAEGCRVVKVIALLDRHQGGSDKLREMGYDFVALLSADPSGEVSLG
jgi:orotate phosphoribosyltransferase